MQKYFQICHFPTNGELTALFKSGRIDATGPNLVSVLFFSRLEVFNGHV